ncbi:hypothetical protein BDQ12DRAFT_661303 [Crucibulum laeve]|uniref:Pre-rRNA processing protein n=1 Tax=Crucibulum laeve TaxID=68775 RepID=A0A5C3MGU0_9AGAR|nr:hypothetical protein BDQ12DRAFT_661303 [Crucibulum laeve]
MEESRPARRSSGIYDTNYGSTQSFHSGAGLRGNAAEPAGVATTTPAGIAVGGGAAAAGTSNTVSGWEDQPPPAAPPAPAQPFYKKRWFIISQIIIIPLGIALLFIILFPVIRAIVQLVVKRTTLDIQVATISNPANGTFNLNLQGNVAHAGIFSATIKFTKPIDVSWVDNGQIMPLGSMRLDETLIAKHKRADLNQTTTFNISHPDTFARFAQTMITQTNFTWQLSSSDLRVQALKFPVAKGIKFEKTVTLSGFNSFDGNVILKDFKLPSDNPAGGINFIAVTELFALSYKDVPLGVGTSMNTNIVNGTNTITLAGTLQPHTSASDLVIVSELFTNYLNGQSSQVIAKGLSTLQADNSTISWLSEGLQALVLDVPFKSSIPIDPIRTITIGSLGLAFDKQSPWTPNAESNSVQATLQLPFGFNLDIGEIQNDFNITKNGAPVAGLSTPLGASESSISVLGQDNTSGSINITITNTQLSCPDSQHPTFAAFNANLTSLDTAEFRLVGRSRAIANMSIGQITLDPILVNVSTSLRGLQGLKGMTTINSVDVTGGTEDGIDLGINVSIFNPSNLNLATGDLTLQLVRDGVTLGTTLLPNLTLEMGNNSFAATSSFAANKSPQGKQTLNEFVGKKDVQLNIVGFDGSTEIASLQEAFNTLDIEVTLPGLKTNLLDTANLEILSTTGRENNISHVTVSLVNPFSTPLHITRISSTVKSFGIPLGTIDSETVFDSKAKSTTQSPSLDLNMNFDPAALFTLTRALAVEAGLDVAPLDGIVKLGDIQYLSTTGQPPFRRQANIFSGFDLPTFVQSAFKKLKSDVELSADVTLGDYQTTLQYTQSAVPTVTDKSLNLILPILALPIVQKIVGGSTLGIDTVLITDPQQNSFGTKLKGSISNAGPFDAKIAFPSGLTVTWAGKALGSIKMDDVQITGDVGGSIDVDSAFQVADVDHLTDFTKVLLTDEFFDWEISGENLTVSALGIDVSGISLTSKKVTLKGFNGLKGGVQIKSFDLPSNDPSGGIHLTLEATVVNPSQVGIQLSSIGFQTFVGGTMIAPVSSSKGVTLAPGSMSALSLVGRLVPQESATGLETVSNIFNNFVHGKDSDVVVHGASAGPSEVTWLNEGIKSLQVATVLPNQGSLSIIKSISLNQLELLFTEDTAYHPATSSKSTDAAFTLPFGFPLDISALEQTITIGFEGNDFAKLAIPKGPSATDVDKRIIHLSFDNVPFAVFDNLHSTFDRFVAATTIGGTQSLHLSGSANADAKTAVGLLSLKDIAFAVDSDIEGLQGLNTKPVTVSNLDVNHGFPDFLLIKVDSALFNPSNLTIGTGDVSFSLQFQDQTIGSADIADLIIVPGNASYPIDVHFAPQGAATIAGRTLLQNFLQGIDVDTTIAGTTESTSVDSLKSALSQIRLTPVTIPALHQTLIKSVSLVFPLDIVKTGIASSSFVLSNPFTASINLLKVGATATFHGLQLGKINGVDVSSNPIRAEGHSDVTSPGLPLEFNLDPVSIIQLLLVTSEENGVSLGPLVAMFQFILDNPDFHPPVTTTVDTNAPTCVSVQLISTTSGNQFDAATAILKSLAGLKVDLDVDTSVKLDDFATDLSFSQKAVPAITDKTALFLIGAVAGPVAQHLVDGSVLAFKEADITNISDDGFDLSLKGSLTNVGPLDALITFTEPVTVTWEGHSIAHIALSPICAAANTGVPNYETNARLTITDLSQFTEFATFLLHNPSFEWTISTDKLRVNALGTVFDNVSLSKVVSFKAFNGLPGVTISNFQLPSDDSAGGIHIETDAVIPSPAQLGIDLGTVTFQSFFEGALVGPDKASTALSASNLSLAPNSVTKTHLSGRIVPQSGSNLDVMGKLFSNFLAGQNQTLETRGDSVQPSGSSGPVSWLSTAFKTLALDVILPGEKLQVIQSITLNDLSVVMQTADQAFAPPTSSEFTLAKYKNPFEFSLQVVESGQTIILSSLGTDIAQLDLPKEPANGGVSTGNVVDLQISFKDQPLKSLNNAAFAQMFAGVTLMDTLDLELKGTADVTARTSIGDIPISGIPFDVPSSLKGINSFGHTAVLSNVSVTGSGGNGGSEFIISPLMTALQNPSNISLDTVGVSLPVIFSGVPIGRAVINELDLKPGENVAETEFHYMPADANDTIAQSFLTDFIQTGNQLDLTIDGDMSSSPFPSLQPGLSNLVLATHLNGLNQPDLITHVHVVITLDSLVTNLVSVDFDVHNPLDADLVLEFVQSDAGVNGEVFAQFSQPFSSFVVPPGQTVNSGLFDNVLLTQGAIASLDIIPLGVLDIAAASTVRIGQGGYQIPWLKLQQQNVPTAYDLSLGFAALKQKAKELNATNSAVSSTTSKSAVVSASASASEEPSGSFSAPQSSTAAEASERPVAASPSVASSPKATSESPKETPSPAQAAAPEASSVKPVVNAKSEAAPENPASSNSSSTPDSPASGA